MSKLYVTVALNPANNYALLHKPIVKLNDGAPQQCECRANVLLERLKTVGFSGEEIQRAKMEIEATGHTVFESIKISDADLESVLLGCERESNERTDSRVD